MINRLLATLLFIAGAGTMVIGIASYWHGIPYDELWVVWPLKEPKLEAAVVDGTVHVLYMSRMPQRKLQEERKGFAGFYVKSLTSGDTLARGGGVPFWALFVVLMVQPTVVFFRGPWRRRRRRRHGQCIRCGYNLTGLTEPRCPECGLEFTRLP
ncbi:MAG TPA: hypothetical protein PKK06_12120 [Phycisphaerae bacterium]|nr:hypothetical protein [Phycisphaerae bacterium]HNU46357.1 hypothetical protein [Phycisphaerae bacterium]